MKTYLGIKGLGNSWQEPFPIQIKCHKCKGNCRPMFTVLESSKTKGSCVADLHDNTGAKKDGKYWVHDFIACSVYLCEDCFEPNALINQV